MAVFLDDKDEEGFVKYFVKENEYFGNPRA